MAASTLDPKLKQMVHDSVRLFGEVIKRHTGPKLFKEIEDVRESMVSLRLVPRERQQNVLKELSKRLAKLNEEHKFQFAHAFALMLEVMNACENAYRSHVLSQRKAIVCDDRPESVIFVLTAHPTEARSPQNMYAFSHFESLLVSALRDQDFLKYQDAFINELEILWRAPLARERKPRVEDEAEYIYSLVLNDRILPELIAISQSLAPIYLRSWVGGDKDGHPGVNEKTMLNSLNLSRGKIVSFVSQKLNLIEADLKSLYEKELTLKCRDLKTALSNIKKIKAGDGKRVSSFRKKLKSFSNDYEKAVGACHPELKSLYQLSRMFPAYVIPLELRESSDVLMEALAPSRKSTGFAIVRMVNTLNSISLGGDPRWYVRGFIISMTESMEHVRAGMKIVKKGLGALKLPVIPLFEQRGALLDSGKIVKAMLADREYSAAVRSRFENHFEVMLGYSDSSKEMGAIQSRVLLGDTIQKLDTLITNAKHKAVFFHGSGGSIDRGGGSIQEQTAWWPESSLKIYKATIQGEMVERTFSTPVIARSHVERIVQQGCLRATAKVSTMPKVVEDFAKFTSDMYSRTITNPEFLEVVEKATPYRYLNALKIGSRPSKRSKTLTVSGLRAIPWVLCWTQTRVLFPTWWGIGSAWKEFYEEANALRTAFEKNELFRSYVKLLGFTLAKVELPIWNLALENSGLTADKVAELEKSFLDEYLSAVKFVKAMSGSEDLLWFRPWLGESIHLRSPMIHPLNIIQLQVVKANNQHMIRETVAGISNGMLTTG